MMTPGSKAQLCLKPELDEDIPYTWKSGDDSVAVLSEADMSTPPTGTASVDLNVKNVKP